MNTTAFNGRISRSNVSWKKLNGYANINHQQSLTWSDSLGYLRQRFDIIPHKYRDPRIAEALNEVEEQPPSRIHLIEYMISLYRLGFQGVEVSQEILCETIKRMTHTRRFGITTLRNSVKWAINAGYIRQSWLPIGKRVVVKNGEYRTKRIRRYEVTYKIQLLVSILRLNPEKFKPSLQIIDNNADNNDKMPHDPTCALTAHNPNGEQPGDSFESPGMLLKHCQFEDDRNHEEKSRSPEHEEFAPIVANKPTKPRLTGATVEHESFKSSAGACQRKRPKNTAVRFRRRKRASTPTTYRQARRNFLHELWIFLKPETKNALSNAFDLYRIAELQTQAYYPHGLPTALDWYDRLISLYFENWHKRRKIIDREIVPALQNFAADWTPPAQEGDDIEANQRAFEAWQFSLMPEPGISVHPDKLTEYYRSWPYVRAILSSIHAGQTTFEHLDPHDNLIYRFCRLFFC